MDSLCPIEQFQIFTRRDVHITSTVSERTLTDSNTDSTVTVYTHKAELFHRRRQVLVKEFAAASSDVILKVSITNFGGVMPMLIQRQTFEAELKRAKGARYARGRNSSPRHLI